MYKILEKYNGPRNYTIISVRTRKKKITYCKTKEDYDAFCKRWGAVYV